MAHEIGHAVLHRFVAKCTGGLIERPRKSLHSSRRAVANNGRSDAYRVEREADEFARELLMPSKAVCRQFEAVFGCEQLVLNSGKMQLLFCVNGLRKEDAQFRAAAYVPVGSVFSLARFFGTSVSAMAFRLEELDLITES
jgi:Zn-dependent peptidase ImmA (M78 family)